MTEHIYPRFLGIDGSGDFVWELADGRWTWGDDPHAAADRRRTFEPVRYIEKYGRPVGLGETIDRKAEAELDPAAVLASITPRPAQVDRGGPLGKAGERGAHRALARFLDVLDGWIDGARSNHDGLGHSGEPVGDQCWHRFHPSDIRNMVNDAAREVGLAEFPLPDEPEEDKVR